jgi:uncharacterized protein YndB with AHSA1/START domain
MAMQPRARVSMWIDCPPDRVFDAFVDPQALECFWLLQASGKLEVAQPVHWSFLVPGANVDTTATRLDRPFALEWIWSDGSRVEIALMPIDGGTAVTVINDQLPPGVDGGVEAALNATEGFALVVADLKTWIESGVSAGIARGKAKLIRLRGQSLMIFGN